MTPGFPPPPEPLGDDVTFTSDTPELPPLVLTRITAVYEVRLDDWRDAVHPRRDGTISGTPNLPGVDAVRVDIGDRDWLTSEDEYRLARLATAAPIVQVVGSRGFGVRRAAYVMRQRAQQEYDDDREYRERADASWPLAPDAAPPADPPPALVISAETTALLIDQARNPEKRPEPSPRPKHKPRQENDT